MSAFRNLQTSSWTILESCQLSSQVAPDEVTACSWVGFFIPSEFLECFDRKLFSNEATDWEPSSPDGLWHGGSCIKNETAGAFIGFSPHIVGATIGLPASINALLLRYHDLVKFLACKSAERSRICITAEWKDTTNAWPTCFVGKSLHLDDGPILEEASAEVQLFPNIVSAGRNRQTSCCAIILLE